MKTIEDLKWKRCGTLAAPENIKDRGVYLMVYEGRVKRVFYVGTATGRPFITRWDEHKAYLSDGLFTFWRGIETGDIYDLMQWDGLKDNNMVHHFKEQAKYKPCKLWGAANAKKTNSDTRVNSLNEEERWTAEWRDYALNTFAPNLALWVCQIEGNCLPELLETQIQQSLGNVHHLGYWTIQAPQNWLGKQERRDCPLLKNYRFVFTNLPEVDAKSAEVLRDLNSHLDLPA